MNDERLMIGLSVDFGSGPQDLFVQLPVDATGGDLYRLLGSAESGLGLDRTPPLLYIERTRRPLLHDELLTEATLMSGDRLSPVVEPVAGGAAGFELLTGPAQGRAITVPIGSGEMVLGRTSGIELDDRSLSRRHAQLTLTRSGLTVDDLGSTNGTVVNGEPVESGRPVEIQIGDVVELGRIGLRLVSLPVGERRLDGSAFAYHSGSLGFQQSPRELRPRPPMEFELPAPPVNPPRRRFPLASALVPLLIGAVMAVIFTPVFALFMALSPLMVIWTFLDDRRSGRKTFEAERLAFEVDLERWKLDLADARDRADAWHRWRTPLPGQIRRWVRTGAKELWGRRPRHDDFLLVAVGTAPQPGPLQIEMPDQGSVDLLEKLDAVAAPYRAESDRPVVIDLASNPVVGITGGGSVKGASDAAAGVARGLVAQLVGLRSPKDLTLAVLAPEHEDWWQWTPWLPHVRIDGEHGERMVAGNDVEAKEIFGRLLELAESRAVRVNERIGTADQWSRHVVVVIQPPLALAPAAVARLLDLAPAVGVSVLYIAPDRQDLPGDVSIHIEVSGPADGSGRSKGSGTGTALLNVAVHYLEAGMAITGIEPWVVSAAEAESLGRELAPVVDVTVDRAGSAIPEAVSLPAVHRLLGDGAGSPTDHEAMARRWSADPRGLLATVGQDADGPVTVDLVADGPHALVAGTTGAGKSEFLQTLIAGLAVRYSPADLNFILIDYKGGSAFRQCGALPHTVGFVTDLDDHLAERALISLRAELRYREEVLAEAEVSDLAEMRQRYRHRINDNAIPPSLVIVVDEFAALRTEVPEFVDGLVDVAQRGRSMGVHMILATQKPAGVITPQIEANTNIRVALRMANPADSRDVIGSTAAAEIASDQPGRALLKIGGSAEPRPFQSAYVGGRSEAAEVVPGVASMRFGASPGELRLVRLPGTPPAEASMADLPMGAATIGGDGDEGNDLERIVSTAGKAWSGQGRAPLRRPWLPPLPPVVRLSDLADDDGSSAAGVVVGLADIPQRQHQQPYRLDLSGAGHVAVYGTSGSGKTTLLRTLAVELAQAAASADGEGSGATVVYAIDFDGGLSMLSPLPVVADVIAGSDVERLELLLDHLQSEVERRRDLPRGQSIVVLVDGFGPFWAALGRLDHGRRADGFAMLLSQARSVGIHFVVTADQRSALPYQCLGSMGLRLVQRMTSVDEYRALEIQHPPTAASMPPGRTLVVGGPEVQIAVPVAPVASSVDGDRPSEVDGPAQAEVIAAVGADLVANGAARRGPAMKALPEVVSVREIDDVGEFGVAADSLVVPLGLGPSHVAVTVDLTETPSLLVVGAGGSGRSTALVTLGRQLADVIADRRALAGKRTSPLATLDAASAVPPAPYTTVIVDRLDQSLIELAAEVERRADGGFDAPMLLAVDDADQFFDNNTASAALTTIVLKGRDAGVVLAMSATTFRTSTAYETWIRALRSAGQGLVLQPDGDKDEDIFDVRFPRGTPRRFPAGRGYLIVRSTVQVVQVAVADDLFPG